MLYFSSIILGFLDDAQKHNTRIFEHNVSDPSCGPPCRCGNSVPEDSSFFNMWVPGCGYS